MDFEFKGISTIEAAKFETLFKLLDSEGTGTIDEGELAELMPRMGVFLTDEELHNLFLAVDIDNSGDIDFPEFLQLMSRHRETNQLALLEGDKCFENLVELSKLNTVFRTDDKFMWFWDTLVMGTILYWMGIALYEDVRTSQTVHVSSKIFFSIVLLLDIVKGVFTCVSTGDTDTLPKDSVTHSSRIYFRSFRFVIDFITAIPIDVLLLLNSHDSAARYLQNLRILKVFCIGSLFRKSPRDTMTAQYARFFFAVVPIIKICFWACTTVHLMSILWMLVSPGDTLYIDAVYFVVYTLTTTGYGDIEVTTPDQKIYAIFLFCCATCVTGLVIGKLVQFSQQADLETDSFRKMLETLAALEYLDIPSSFKQEVLAFQWHSLRHSHSLFSDVMVNLPDVIQNRMELYAKMRIVRQVPIFEKIEEVCVAKLAQSLRTVFVPPEEYIVIAGEEGDEMFFLFHGMCAIWLPCGKWVATIKRGGVFGESALLASTRRQASIKSLTYCKLFRLDKADFHAIAESFPNLSDTIASVSIHLTYDTGDEVLDGSRDRYSRHIKKDNDSFTRKKSIIPNDFVYPISSAGRKSMHENQLRNSRVSPKSSMNSSSIRPSVGWKLDMEDGNELQSMSTEEDDGEVEIDPLRELHKLHEKESAVPFVLKRSSLRRKQTKQRLGNHLFMEEQFAILHTAIADLSKQVSLIRDRDSIAPSSPMASRCSSSFDLGGCRSRSGSAAGRKPAYLALTRNNQGKPRT